MCAALAASTAPAGAEPPVNSAGHCLTPVAADDQEPACNPFAASPAWSTAHRGSYAQGSSPFPAPHPGDRIAWQDLQFGNEIPVILQISSPYPDGRRTVWFSAISGPETRPVYKLDYDTGDVLARATALDEGESPGVPTTSGVYSMLDRDNHLVTVRPDGLAVYGDAEPGLRTSSIRLLRRFRLPRRALCREDDRIIGITLTYSGEIAFATVQGMLGVVPREPAGMRDENLIVASINGTRCGDPNVQTSDLEEINNSISADEDGGIYPVSTRAQYKFGLAGGRLDHVWRAPYPSGGGAAGSTLSSGSGSTPDVVGTNPGDDRFIVITDGQQLMHVTFLWKDEIPRGWKPIAPGLDRRIACSYPVTFGDPQATQSVSEQSVLTRGYSAIVVNNSFALDRAFALLPPNLRPASALTGNIPANGPRGMERIDWDPRTRTCHSVWANREVSIPNAVPTLSTESGLIYGAGVRDAVWGLEGVDFRTGESRLWVPTTPLPTENSFFAATTVGPDGSIWVGGTSGISVFRGPRRPEPEHRCKDLEAPHSTIVVRGRNSTRLTHGRALVRVRSRDLACGLRAVASLARVEVAIARKGPRGCFHLRSRGGLTRSARPCAARRWLAAKRRAGRFELRLRARLPAGRYEAVARARDAAGNLERPGRARLLRVRLYRRAVTR